MFYFDIALHCVRVEMRGGGGEERRGGGADLSTAREGGRHGNDKLSVSAVLATLANALNKRACLEGGREKEKKKKKEKKKLLFFCMN